MSKTLKLNNGREIPVIGLGTYKSGKGEVEQAIKDAIDIGYRHIDCAWFYGNEKEVGRGIKAKIEEGVIKREDLFVTTKLWNNFHAKHHVVPKLGESLSNLQLDYVDLFLIHWPFAFKESGDLWPVDEPKQGLTDIGYLETWEGMEDCLEKKLTKSIGLSNFNSKQIDDVLEHCKIKPVVNQVECNPNLNQKQLINFCKDRGIVIVGYCPLGRSENAELRGYPPPTIFDPKVKNIGKKYKKSAAQVVLNYLISLGISVIPKSVNKSRLEENFNVLDFTLDESDVAYLDSCNKNLRICALKEFENLPHYPFNIDF